ncbi:hypothetical protein EGR_11019 [Echinococcus granulosus]|uniref:Uncharacterized protein n=1 Tax=Echinococcus granulosus TaxID=6210 RepID=W6TZ99_ECHGR|nr:hypothetical protein EGR_11019 [Echinococcus granulosus]EUB54125.1 hypothetical protein EGR_11019 [Echinococcus granulosus]
MDFKNFDNECRFEWFKFFMLALLEEPAVLLHLFEYLLE